LVKVEFFKISKVFTNTVGKDPHWYAVQGSDTTMTSIDKMPVKKIN